jgi:hypothetical protein
MKGVTGKLKGRGKVVGDARKLARNLAEREREESAALQCLWGEERGSLRAV